MTQIYINMDISNEDIPIPIMGWGKAINNIISLISRVSMSIVQSINRKMVDCLDRCFNNNPIECSKRAGQLLKKSI